MIFALECSAKKIEYRDTMYAEIITNYGKLKLELWHAKTPLTVENFLGLASGEKEWTNPISGEKEKGKKFYDGLTFHRVIKDFMIQGGCPLGTGTGGPGYKFEDECFDKSTAKEIKGSFSTDEDAMTVFNQLLLPYFQANPNPDKELLAIVTECQKKQSPKPLTQHPVEFYREKTKINSPVMTGGTLIADVAYGTICMANSGPGTNGSQFFIVTKKDGCNWLNGKHTVFGKVIEGMDVAEKIQFVEADGSDKPVKAVVIEKINVLEK